MRSAAEEASHDTEHADYIQVTDTDLFLERIFPVPSDIVEEVMTALQSPVAVSDVPVYAEGRWTAFPADDSLPCRSSPPTSDHTPHRAVDVHTLLPVGLPKAL